MNRLAQLLAAGPPDAQAFAAYAAQVPEAEAEAARALLEGQRPRRLAPAATLLTWVAEARALPPPLLAACLAVTRDKTEATALLLAGLPQSQTPSSLPQVLQELKDRESFLRLASGLTPPALLLLTRLAAGSFRQGFAPPPAAPAMGPRRHCLALLTLLAPALPEATFALPSGNGLLPLVKLPLTLPQTPQILAWARAHTINRFGPLREVAPSQVFELSYAGTRPNPRRKCGLDLLSAELVAWHPDLTPDRATPLSALALADPWTPTP